MNRFTGFIKSTLTGNEIKYGAVKPSLPIEYHIFNNPRVLNQGNNPTCVNCCIYLMVNWHALYTGTEYNITTDSIWKSMGRNKTGLLPLAALLSIPDIIDTFAIIDNMEAAKSALIANGPIMACLPYYGDDDILFWKGRKQTGGHAVILTGYDDEGFIMQNSWGMNWGDNGRIKLPYSDYNAITELWTIVQLVWK